VTQNEGKGFSLPVARKPVRTAIVPWRPALGGVLALSTIVLCGFLLAAQTAKADQFTFIDLTEAGTTVQDCNNTGGGCVTLSATNPTNGRATLGTCIPAHGVVPEQPCGLIINAPTGATSGVATANFGLTEGVNGPLSDEFDVTSIASVGVGAPLAAQTEFDSCTEGAPNCTLAPDCNALGAANCAPENGSTGVLVNTITWNIGGTDTIFVESDVEATSTVPEPASLILFGSGLALAGGFILRRRKVVTPSPSAVV